MLIANKMITVFIMPRIGNTNTPMKKIPKALPARSAPYVEDAVFSMLPCLK
jgi:hypothetical protein